MIHTRIRSTASSAVATMALATIAFGLAAAAAGNGAGLRNCVEITGKKSGGVGCYELVWVDGDAGPDDVLEHRASRARRRRHSTRSTSWRPDRQPAGLPAEHLPARPRRPRRSRPEPRRATAPSCRASSSCAAVRASPAAHAFRRGPPSAGPSSCRLRRPSTARSLTSTGVIEAAADAGLLALINLGPDRRDRRRDLRRTTDRRRHLERPTTNPVIDPRKDTT